MRKYLVYDVFTEAPFGGNQLAVFPDATSLPEGDLQSITQEFNFSEVTFCYPPTDAAHTARVRIFTPTSEIPLAGHPTIGTAVALASLGHGPEMVLELGVGPIACVAEGRTARFTTPVPLKTHVHPEIALVSRTLGLPESEFVTDTHPPVMAGVGLPFTITEVRSREALSSVAIDVGGMREGNERHPSGLDFAQFVYFRGKDVIHARMFAPLDNVPEDPATGSACAALGALLRSVEARDQSFTVHQGEDMGRPSVVSVRATPDGTTISGSAIKLMEGQLVY